MSSTPLHLPPLLPYPITLLSLTPPATTINRADPLLTYAYTHHPPARSAEPPERRSGRWLSPVSGSLGPWAVAKGDVVAGPREVGTVDEECAHPVQLGGLCAVCGLDLTVSDYLSEGFSDPSASSSSAAPSGPSASSSSLSISHSTPLLRVSHREASRLHSTHQAHLHSARKLLLIVDLDQTVVHATVDPTVGGFLDDVARADGGERGLGAEARRNLGEVGKFTLDEKGGRGCWYYLKPRPNLAPFLARLAAQFEMHVYTMGTRAYADAVCRLIDPTGAFFGGRILSRDESGSLTHKSLDRLFPVDNSMVVVIDDRADVWGAARNLVKVVPYEFFVGTGDINGAFLPKPAPPSPTSPPLPSSSSSSSSLPAPAPAAGAVSTPARQASAAQKEQEQEKEQEESHARDLEGVREERPLQAAMERAVAESSSSSSSSSAAVAGGGKADGEPATSVAASAADADEDEGGLEPTAATAKDGGEPKPKWDWLFADADVELGRVEKVLNEIHKRYYYALSSSAGNGTGTGKPTRRPDVKEIIDRLKRKVLAGVTVVFSGVIPLGVRPESFEWWRTAEAFGATCSLRVDGSTTHLIATKPGTQKVHEASRPARRERIAIVQPDWLLSSCALWERQPEEPYMLELEPSTTPPPPSAPADGKGRGEGEAEGEGEGEEKVGELEEGRVEEIDWGQADRELEEFLEGSESDDEDDGDGAEQQAADGAGGAAPAPTGSEAVEPVEPVVVETTPAPPPIPLQTTLIDPTASSSDPLLLARRKRPRPSSVAPSEPDSLFDAASSAPPTPPPTTTTDGVPSPKRSRLGRATRSPSPDKPTTVTAAAGTTNGSAPPSPKRQPRTVSFDDTASIRSTASSVGGGGGGAGTTDDSDDDELDDWAVEFAGSMQADDGGDGGGGGTDADADGATPAQDGK